ncbi:MFS transporter [Parapedobacter indicus]|uniref:Sugar phosphate permease n=1 Tax=Parapedobacter indicus TaxID=1477437 RepID=A0A1I3GWD3_9SPHI|nr:MFS transporter [Parapedobacter indicus]PPL02803.1 sugar phosphate permease [Parapedobacter indicus]SFI27632.1 Sugar phosphate permease [Parapedobacter indicus]
MKKKHYKWELVAIFWVAYFLNQGDRQIFNVVIPLIRADLHITDVQIGWVATLFTLVYGLMVPVAGFVGDVLRRKWIVFFSLLVFSVGTLCTGLSSGTLALILFRSIATGGGEAFYYPAATSLIGQFHRETRAMAMSIHQTSLYVGVVLSGFVAGYIGEHHGWRVAFYVFGSMGVLWSFVTLWRINDTPLPATSGGEIGDSPGFGETVRTVFAKRTVYFLSLAFGLMCFVNVGYLTWMPTYLHERFGLSLAAAGLHSTLYHFAFAFVGVIVGARIADRLALRRPAIRMEVELLGLLLGAPFIFWMGQSDTQFWCYVAMGLFGVFRGIYDSNLFAALFDVIEPKYRSSSIGVMLSIGFIIGALAPVLLGWAKTAVGLDLGISLLGCCYLVGALLIAIGLKLFFKKDYYNEFT